jgi:hypothetical protein
LWPDVEKLTKPIEDVPKGVAPRTACSFDMLHKVTHVEEISCVTRFALRTHVNREVHREINHTIQLLLSRVNQAKSRDRGVWGRMERTRCSCEIVGVRARHGDELSVGGGRLLLRGKR